MFRLLPYLPSLAAIVVLGILFWGKEKSKICLFAKKNLLPLSLLIFFANGLVYAREMPYWNPVDEGSHFAYIQFVAENKRLPLLTDRPGEEVLAIKEGVYPDKPKTKAESAGLAGYIYEAFQPPLYYLAAVPAYWAGGSNFIHKIYVLRIFNLVQFIVLMAIGYSTLRDIGSFFPRLKHPFVFLGLMFVGFIPSVLARSIAAGNAVTSMIFASLAFWRMAKIFSSGRSVTLKDAAVLGVFTALAILSKFNLLFLVPVVIFFFFADYYRNLCRARLDWRERGKKVLLQSFLYLVVAGIMISPWLAFNEFNYGTMTANTQAREQQKAVVNPLEEKADFGYFRTNISTFMSTVWTPEETRWKALDADQTFCYTKIIHILNSFLILSFLLSALIVFGRLWSDSEKEKEGLLYIVLLAFVFTAAVTGQQFYAAIEEDWPILIRVGRYVHPAIVPIAAVFIFILEEFYAKLKIPKTALYLFCLVPAGLNFGYVFTLLAK